VILGRVFDVEFDMTKRRRTRTVRVGNVKIGSSVPVVVQSMTKVPTTEVSRCVRQINQLVKAGCRLVRVAVPTRPDTVALEKIVERVSVPVIADIHFSAARAIESIEAGASKIRLNPGNIKKRSDIIRIIDAAKIHGTAVRVGINEASIRNLGKGDIPPGRRTAYMVREMKKYIRLFEGRGFDRLILSVKSSNAVRTIEVNRRISEVFDYPIHIGLTHAGLAEDAVVASSVALGTLLAEGIGDTIRVSVSGNPVVETEIAKRILLSLGLYERSSPELIVCPTCARCGIDVVKLARRVSKVLVGIGKPVRVAVMGCIVNGPGEAADADVAVCAAKRKGYIYRGGRRVAVVPEERIAEALLKEVEKL